MMARTCDECGDLIKPPLFHELTIRVLKTTGGENQDGKQYYGDYCLTCVKNGDAVKDLLAGFGKKNAP